jgi:hypothetical protein
MHERISSRRAPGGCRSVISGSEFPAPTRSFLLVDLNRRYARTSFGEIGGVAGFERNDLLGNRRNDWTLSAIPRPGVASRPAFGRELDGELGAGTNAELPIDLREVPLNRLGADEQGVRPSRYVRPAATRAATRSSAGVSTPGVAGARPRSASTRPEPARTTASRRVRRTPRKLASAILWLDASCDSAVAASRVREECARARTALGVVRVARARGRARISNQCPSRTKVARKADAS